MFFLNFIEIFRQSFTTDKKNCMLNKLLHGTLEIVSRKIKVVLNF